MRLTSLLELYRWRLGEHRAQEILAGMGIAIGVALFFGVLVANSSLVGSASQLLHAVTGKASLQITARSPDGFDERIATEAAELPDVSVAAPLLRQNATLVGPKGRQSVQLVGVAPEEVGLESSATKNLGTGAPLLASGIGVPVSVAGAVGINPQEDVRLLSHGQSHLVIARAVLGTQTVGAIANSPIVVTLLSNAQQLTGLENRITQVLIEPKPGTNRLVQRELKTLAAGKLDVQAADHEVAILKSTAKPTSQSTELFAAVSAMVGFLLALNAMLLTVPERRRFAAELSQQGFAPRQVLVILVSQAVMLGTAASSVGIVLGDVLAHTLFSQVPSYLTLAFPIGSAPVVPIITVLMALACGVIATVLASLVPVMDFRRRRSADAVMREAGEAGQGLRPRLIAGAGFLGLSLIIVVSAVVLLEPQVSVIGGVVLALAAFCVIPALFVATVKLLRPASERLRGSMFALAMVELDATATRAVALAGVAAIAVYGMLAIQGARQDLISGLDRAAVQYLNTADVWVTADDNFLTVDSFPGQALRAAIAKAPGVASVREFQAQLLDIGHRRLWIRARPPDDRALIQASQMLEGNLAQATSLIRHGGWAAVSKGFAEERRLRIGSTFSLPTPTGSARLRVAALTTNVGWPPGAITLNDSDYRRYWQTSEPTALEINVAPGTTPAAGKRAIERAIGNQPGLKVETFSERRSKFEASARQGIQGLSEIAILLLIATSLAIASALSAAIWQRRTRLASLKSHGFDSAQLWRSVLLESGILIGVGCLDGAILGIYGHALASRWLKTSVGFPAPFSPAVGLVALTLVLIIAIALAVISLPGLIAARVPPAAGFQD